MITTRHRLAAAAVAAALTLTLAGCASGQTSDSAGASSSPTAEATATHNDADASFAQMMIVHHEGALEMADLAAETAQSPDVVALAERISAAQGPEIDLMTGWLEAWGEPGPDAMGHGGMDHGGMDMDGMDQAGAMAALEQLSGHEFDRRFLELMTAHHQGAIEMAESEIEHGTNPDALSLARTIIDAQTAEITEMANLMGQL
ncbi:DUF305 domain-containing protein [Cellulomonas sp.]|uniref:DUF305 domain-containing protein n=1 Tax=Cellulomonas sp. TaxID=40001 RepID=UPI00258A4464|nr:DUF305 domain-containing protein [Cellulomonas sp.]MCR6688597.1 DUF305 domain-containing protein [Cellulomonas sp.]